MAGRDGSGIGRLRGMLGGKSVGGACLSGHSREAAGQAVQLLHDYEQSGLGWFWSTDARRPDRLYLAECRREIGQERRRACRAAIPFAVHPRTRRRQISVERTLPLIFSGHKTFSELPIRAATEGAEVWWAISGRPQFKSSGEFTGFHGNGTDITASRIAQRDASRLAMFDSLTGLSNRHSMDKRLTGDTDRLQGGQAQLRADDDRPRPLQAGQRYARPSGRR